MLETHNMMSSLIFHHTLILVLRLVLLLKLCLMSLMDLTIAHMVLVHERTALFPRRPGFPAGGSHTILSRVTWMVHIFPVVVPVPLVQMVMCNRL
jgi:hypothetical protein